MLPKGFADGEICIVGLGYVGLTLAAAMADSGFRVHGLEKQEAVLNSLKKGMPHFWEQGLEYTMRRVLNQKRMSVSRELDPSVSATVYIITVGTPLGPDGKARLDMVGSAAKQVAAHMQDGALVILRSTVRLGTARNVVRPILEASGKRFELAVCPERTLEGRALTELRELPQIIGSDLPETTMRAAQIFLILTPTILRVPRFETAELIKLVDNTYRDVRFAFGNEVARICSAVGIDASEVIRAGKLGYPRTNVAWPGPVGGPCLEKDPHILAESVRDYGIEIDITTAARMVNERLPCEAAATIRDLADGLGGFPEQPTISLLGWAFKGEPATSDLRGTMAIPIFEAVRKAFPNASFRGFDELVPQFQIAKLGVTPVDNLADAFADADIAIIMNNHKALTTMPIATLMNRMRAPAFVYDFWNIFSNVSLNLPKGRAYLALGGSQQANWARQVRHLNDFAGRDGERVIA